MNVQKMMKQVQQMQKEMAKAQAQLAEERIEASVGGGMVKAVFNGQGKLLELSIDPEVVDKDDVEILQDLVLSAVNEGSRQAQDLQAKRMSALTGGLGGPGGPGLPGLF